MHLGKEQSTGIATDQDDLAMTPALAGGHEADGEPERRPAAVKAEEPAAAASR
jgi:hypothetical protein